MAISSVDEASGSSYADRSGRRCVLFMHGHSHSSVWSPERKRKAYDANSPNDIHNGVRVISSGRVSVLEHRVRPVSSSYRATGNRATIGKIFEHMHVQYHKHNRQLTIFEGGNNGDDSRVKRVSIVVYACCIDVEDPC
jgi:hypothetical protein